MQEKDNPFKKNKDDNRNLFSDESEIFGEEREKSRAEVGEDLPQEKQGEDSFPEDEVALSYEEEKPANPVRRVLLIAASIVAGIALGIGGYLFFTAGNRHLPVERQVVRVLPEPAAVAIPPAAPSEKPNVIPEIPVKAEPQEPEQGKPESVQSKEGKKQVQTSKVDASQAKKEPGKKVVAERTSEEAMPVAAQAGEKKYLTVKPPAREETLAAVKGKLDYYVQAGLFENEANAKAVADKLKQKGYASSVLKVEGKDKKVMFRVIAGTYANFKRAVEVSETLNRQGVKAIVHKQ